MAMFRQEFEELPVNKLKNLIKENLSFIGEAAPFEETKNIISNINTLVTHEKNRKNLQSILISLMQIVEYWDDHQDKRGLFPPVQKNIVNEMLTNATANLSIKFNK